MQKLILLIAILICFRTVAQDGIGIGTTTVPSDAILNISSTSKGVILPKVDATTRAGINPASDGLLAYDPDEKAFYYYDSAALDWKRLVQENSFGTVPLGGIIMWSGTLDNVPDGYVLCDGIGTFNGNDVPNLMDRFIMGGTNQRLGDRVALQMDLDSDYAVGEGCSEFELLWSFTIEIIDPPPGADPYAPTDLCGQLVIDEYHVDFTDEPGNSCEETASGKTFPGVGCYTQVVNCTSAPNPDYYLDNPACRIAAQFYEIAFIMRVK